VLVRHADGFLGDWIRIDPLEAEIVATGSDSILAGPPQPPAGAVDGFSGRRAAADPPIVMASRPLGVLLVVFGVAVVAVGLLVWSGALSWFGHLPGDVRIDRGNVILVSLVLTLILNLLRRFF
jgi:hypothetical protein